MKVEHTEHGVDFITLYFKKLVDANLYAERLYAKFKRIDFPYLNIQRPNFRHLPGDPPHFHADGGARDYWPEAFSHFHIIYPHRPTQEDWEYLYKHCNDVRRDLNLDRGLETREVIPS